MLKHKKGDLMLETFPVMILVIVIMGLFVFLSYSIAKISPPPKLATISGSVQEDLLLKNVNMDLGKESKNMLVLDAFILSKNYIADGKKVTGYSFESNFKEALRAIVNKDNSCLLFLWSDVGDPVEHLALKFGKSVEYEAISLKWVNDGNIEEGPNQYSPTHITDYKKQGLVRSTSFIVKGSKEEQNKPVYVSYYYGGCLNG